MNLLIYEIMHDALMINPIASCMVESCQPCFSPGCPTVVLSRDVIVII